MSATRLSAERLEQIRRWADSGLGQLLPYAMFVPELIAELDAVTRERDALQSRLDEFISARATGRSANDD